ncbi:hypothetical protein LSH36_119g07032 [Paralvinella palmiformis]|uniref:Death domain-containing protein n=1 Tax=Paralvinella palmiformis TaxID=53620 RepID=A0AAD9JXU6_9ANNE|nr:hypothetical protein LSH36_119g07032 [Paralvinella palmiformis]
MSSFGVIDLQPYSSHVPLERYESNIVSSSVPFHDIHREVPESGLLCDSISLSQNTEPSVGTIQIAETLNLQLKYKKRPLASRQEQNCTPDTTDSAIDSARSSTVMANVYQESCNVTVLSTSRSPPNAIQRSNNNHQHLDRNATYSKTGKNGKRRKIVPIKVRKHIISDDQVEKVAEHLGHDWRRLGRKLGFNEGALDAFEYDHHQAGLCEIIYQMLLMWKEKQGVKAYVKYVATYLVELKRADVAKLLSVK